MTTLKLPKGTTGFFNDRNEWVCTGSQMGNNILDSVARPPEAFPDFNERPPVSIAIGLVSEDAIILAADSQTTCGNRKRDDAEKISIIKFADCAVMIAQAGNADRAQRAIEIFAELAVKENLVTRRTAVDLLEKAVLQAKKELRTQQADCSMEELRDFIWKHDQDFKLLLAHFFDNKPCFYIIDFFIGVANQERCHYATIGSGADLADYMLREYFKPKTLFATTLATALYVIEEVKKHDSYCSGDTRLAFAAPSNDALFIHRPLVNSIACQLSTVNEETREDRNRTMTEILESVAKVWIKEDDDHLPTEP